MGFARAQPILPDFRAEAVDTDGHVFKGYKLVMSTTRRMG
jgi:hypothetical protein